MLICTCIFELEASFLVYPLAYLSSVISIRFEKFVLVFASLKLTVFHGNLFIFLIRKHALIGSEDFPKPWELQILKIDLIDFSNAARKREKFFAFLKFFSDFWENVQKIYFVKQFEKWGKAQKNFFCFKFCKISLISLLFSKCETRESEQTFVLFCLFCLY